MGLLSLEKRRKTVRDEVAAFNYLRRCAEKIESRRCTVKRESLTVASCTREILIKQKENIL